MSSRESLQDLLRNSQCCLVDFVAEGNDDVIHLDNTLSGSYIVNYVPLQKPLQQSLGAGDNEERKMGESSSVVDMDVDMDEKASENGILESCATTSFSNSPSSPDGSPPPGPPCPHIHIYQDFGFQKPPSAPSMKNFMMFINEIVLISTQEDTLIVEYKTYKIYQHYLTCLAPGHGQWLQDDVMDYYLALLTARNKSNPIRYSSTYTFPSTFYALLSSAKGLKLVEQSADGENIFENDLIFFPVCQTNHWRLIVANVAEKSVKAYNSFDSRPDVLIVKNIIRYLKHEHLRIYKKNAEASVGNPAIEPPEWIGHTDVKVPQQGNGSDCGVFTLLFSDYLSRNDEFDFNEDHMLYFRAKILYECISGRLLS